MLAGPTDSRSRTSRPGKAQPPPGNKAAPCLMASPGGAALTGPTRCEPVRGPGRPGKVPAATRQNNGATGNVPARAALSRATASMLFPDRLRSQYFFCAMSLMALGAHRGRPVAAAPCTPGLGPARMVNKLTAGRTDRRPGKASAATRQKNQRTYSMPLRRHFLRPSGKTDKQAGKSKQTPRRRWLVA